MTNNVLASKIVNYVINDLRADMPRFDEEIEDELFFGDIVRALVQKVSEWLDEAQASGETNHTSRS